MAKDSRTGNILSICDQALALDDEARQAFVAAACGDDSRFRASVESVLRAITAAGGFLVADGDSPQSVESVVGTHIGSYRVVECLGEGGMGAVFLAERDHGEFVQKVAIKLVRGQFIVPELIERFDAERRILATLNHPYIAALIDGGTTSAGVPYLVMEYIDGTPVDVYCDRHKLDIGERILLIQKIAMAVQAAHQHLIVHRDLKPSNVLITADGIPKLLDFGIAKLIPEDPSAASGHTTIFGHQAMTPNYASPEHILENVVTTVSDVYSLGILSYELLTGNLPYRVSTASQRDMLKSVEKLTVPRASTQLSTARSNKDAMRIASRRATTPGKLRKQLSGDLDNILMKALHREPERRYASVAGFGADLGRFLKDMPVEARPDSAAYRMQRFVSRNKAGVAASVALAFTLLVALGVSSWAYFRAEAARAETAQRFDEVRAIANTLMFDVYDEVSKISGATRAREILATSAQSYLDSLAASDFASPDVQLEAGQGYERLGDVLGGVDDMSLGDRRTAAENYRLAETYLSDLHAKYPDNREYALTAAALQHKMAGHALYSENDIPSARQHANNSIAIYAAIEDRSDDVVLGHVGALKELADTYDWEGKPAKSAEILQQGLVMLADIDTSPAGNPAATAAKAGMLRDLGDAYYYLDDLAGSIDELRMSRRLYNEVLPHAENVPSVQRNHAITLFSLAGAEVDYGQKDEALSTIDEGLSLSRSLLDLDPDDTGTLQLYTTIAQQRGAILSELGRHDEAIVQAMASFELKKDLNERTSNDANAFRGLTIETYNVGTVYLNAGRIATACEWLTDASGRLGKLLENGELSGYDETILLPDVEAARAQACD